MIKILCYRVRVWYIVEVDQDLTNNPLELTTVDQVHGQENLYRSLLYRVIMFYSVTVDQNDHQKRNREDIGNLNQTGNGTPQVVNLLKESIFQKENHVGFLLGFHVAERLTVFQNPLILLGFLALPLYIFA